MSNLEIKIKTKDNSLEPIAKYENAEPLKLELALIMEGATGNGRTGIGLYFSDESGKTYFANTTARIILNGLAPAIRGAMHLFNDDPRKG